VVADTKRGKTTPVNAREGCLLLIRALIEIVGKPAEPYVVGAFLAAELEECTSAHSAVREAAEDTCTELLALANPWACRGILAPILLQSLRCTEWRIKAAALERLTQCATATTTTAPTQVHKMIPKLIPGIASQVWDTKAQVSKGAKATRIVISNLLFHLLSIPFVVNSVCKPTVRSFPALD
jgi:hypothetical protein